MVDATKRRFLVYGGAAVVALGFGVLRASQTRATQDGAGAGYEHRFMAVEEMRANGGLIVDIRTAPEWAETGVIEGAELVTFENADSFLAEIGPKLSEGQDLILICRSGNRTERAAQMLAGRLPNRIISVDGGMKAQMSNGYRTVAVD